MKLWIWMERLVLLNENVESFPSSILSHSSYLFFFLFFSIPWDSLNFLISSGVLTFLLSYVFPFLLLVVCLYHTQDPGRAIYLLLSKLGLQSFFTTAPVYALV